LRDFLAFKLDNIKPIHYTDELSGV